MTAILHQLRLEFGALAPPLRRQLKGRGLTSKTIAGMQASADAISRLAIVQLLTERETHKARLRLCKSIEAAIRKVAKR